MKCAEQVHNVYVQIQMWNTIYCYIISTNRSFVVHGNLCPLSLASIGSEDKQVPMSTKAKVLQHISFPSINYISRLHTVVHATLSLLLTSQSNFIFNICRGL